MGYVSSQRVQNQQIHSIQFKMISNPVIVIEKKQDISTNMAGWRQGRDFVFIGAQPSDNIDLDRKCL